MNAQAWAALAPILVSLFLQVVKDHLGFSKPFLPVVAMIAGILSAGITAFLAGADTPGALTLSGGLGALIPKGIHGTVLEDSMLGRVLTNVGNSIFTQPTVPPTTPAA